MAGRRRLATVGMLTLGVVAAACGGGARFTAASCPNGIAAAPAVTVTAGRPFTLQLRANHTTPFRWALALPPDPTVARLSGSEYRSDRAGKALAGAGGVECWTFDTVAPGETAIGFVNRYLGATPAALPGQTPRPPDTVVRVTVR